MDALTIRKPQSGFIPEAMRTTPGVPASPGKEATPPTITPEPVPAMVRIGVIFGEVTPGFITASLCQYTSDGKLIQQLNKNVSVPIVDKQLVNAFSSGSISYDDLGSLEDFILNSPEALINVP